MNINCDYSAVSNESKINFMIYDETKRIIRFIVDDFAIPYINGLSLETLSQVEFMHRGGKGLKPLPLARDIKRKLYDRIEFVFYTRLSGLVGKCIRPEIERKIFLNERIPLLFRDGTEEPNFDFKNPISQFYTYIRENFPLSWIPLSNLVKEEAKKFVPDIYRLAMLDEVLKKKNPDLRSKS